MDLPGPCQVNDIYMQYAEAHTVPFMYSHIMITCIHFPPRNGVRRAVPYAHELTMPTVPPFNANHAFIYILLLNSLDIRRVLVMRGYFCAVPFCERPTVLYHIILLYK